MSAAHRAGAAMSTGAAAGRSARRPRLEAALAHHVAGRLDDAAEGYRQLLAETPQDTDVLYLLGVLCCDLGLFEPARRFLDQALALEPEFPEARARLSDALNGLADRSAADGRVDEAERFLAQALKLAPDDGRSLQALGRLALLAGNFAQAETRFLASLQARPDHADTLNCLGLARLQLGRNADAEEPLKLALKIEPGLNQARNNLGLILYRLGRLAEALRCFEEAVDRDPAYRNARINLASTFRTLGRYAEAQSLLEGVVAEHPDAADALSNLGAVYQDQGQAALALSALNRAILVSPDSPTIRWNLSLTQLLMGDFANGWAGFESRWEGCEHLRGGYRMPASQAWRGQRLEGKRLLLWAEQGFGDTLQFIRFAADVAQRGATVMVHAQPELCELLSTAPGVTHVVSRDEPAPPFDFHCPLMSLPHFLQVTEFSQLHGAQPYLRAPPKKSPLWRGRLEHLTGLRVGLVWAGSSRASVPELAAIDARRSIPLNHWSPVLGVPGVSFLSLQKDASAADLRQAAGIIHEFAAQLNDFSDTAAVVDNLDLIISVDTAVAHLAGALGKPVWLLNRHDGCWRWLQGHNDSPWYATLRQFRQTRPGDWKPVITEVAAALAARVKMGHG